MKLIGQGWQWTNRKWHTRPVCNKVKMVETRPVISECKIGRHTFRFKQEWKR